MKNHYQVINYNNKEYIVAKTKKNESFIFDKDDLERLPNVNYYLR
jgi:hypothetical protein